MMRACSSGRRGTILALAAILLLAPPSAWSQTPVDVILYQAGFDEAPATWKRQSNADFAHDSQLGHAGNGSLRISLPPSAELHYPQWQYERNDVSPGDGFWASVWVRVDQLADGSGAYFVLEFLDAQGKRCGIHQSGAVHSTDQQAWQKLTAAGRAPTGAQTLRVALVLNAHGTAWFDDLELRCIERAVPWPELGSAARTVTVQSGPVVQPNFGGVGFHVFHHVHPVTPQMFDEAVGKRWRELNPSFVRMNHDWDWDAAQMEKTAQHMAFFQSTGTEIYLTTWNPKQVQTAEERADYARLIVDQLEFFKRTKGITQLKTYCMSNELTLGSWGRMAQDLTTIRDYHQAIFDELQARKLDIQLLATDASPIDYWPTIQWATENMDAISGVYGGHHYINDRTLEDPRFYPWFLTRLQWGVGLARSKHKQFILGEFGAKQDGRKINGVVQDRCIWFDTPQEPLMPIQVCEATIAALNAGTYALGYWTFWDFPDAPEYCNKWGLSRWSGSDYSARPVYYAYGLLSKFFRGPATVYPVESNDPRLRIAALEHHGQKTWSIAVVNRNATAVPLNLRLDGQSRSAAFRKYVYDPAQPPSHPFGDLPGPVATVAMQDGRLADQLAPTTLTVYTTAYDDTPPGAVRGLKTTRDGDRTTLQWEASSEVDLCYYRVYRAGQRLGSTIATQFVDTTTAPETEAAYRVIAVDQSGNASE